VGILSRQRSAFVDRAAFVRTFENGQARPTRNPTRKGKIMTSTSDKIKGAANEVVGKVKQAVGSATDDSKLRAKGAVQEAKGDAQKAEGQAKDAVKKAIDKA